MKTSDFYYDLPSELIAQNPLAKRDNSKLLIFDRKNNTIEHKHFYDIIDYINSNDALVINETKVIPARLLGTKEESNINIEILLLKRIDKDAWECLVRPGRRLKEGAICTFGNGILKAEIKKCLPDGNRIVEFKYEGVFEEILDKLGEMPLPPYIKEKLKDKDRYQTVYAKNEGSAAAPTAGLHFTQDLLEKLKAKGVQIIPLTLHVGLGTFRAVKADNIEEHHMHSEYCQISKEAAEKINKIRENGGRCICVGTTSVRTLETASKDDLVYPFSGETSIFISPGFKFNACDALITNFHLPESTLLMLISALMGRENALAAYKDAIDKKYRFFSFGDAMFII